MPGRKTYPPTLAGRLRRLLRNRLTDAADVRRAFPPEVLQRLGERVRASEQRHTGQIRICIEAGLPWSYIRRDAPARQRAVTQFGKLRVWDTAHNNGVLIYLLLAEHAIEIVADRGIDTHVDAAEWQAMARRMGQAFSEGRFEDGVTLALEEVSALLVAHFPASPGTHRHSNELPDTPVVI
ncbi:TPM domain-containing protein [Xenophilus sp. Marseille-Q4582]|uniref:TPM domain-containing protein n=1 Tax=Xenophilus sp. Marseille-Q4582 TaxID=2866600 RepID=UPI001CE3CA1F|nr:TPM domain-containing protein [Xenophilus sp. Marseille-Q4582]